MKRFVKKLLFKEGNEKQVISVVVEIDVHQKYLSAKQKFPGLTCKKSLIYQEIGNNFLIPKRVHYNTDQRTFISGTRIYSVVNKVRAAS